MVYLAMCGIGILGICIMLVVGVATEKPITRTVTVYKAAGKIVYLETGNKRSFVRSTRYH